MSLTKLKIIIKGTNKQAIILKGEFQCQPLRGCYEIYPAIPLGENYRAEARNQYSTIIVNKQQLYGGESFATSYQKRDPGIFFVIGNENSIS